jgi:rsbT co-antagonist protein RsbR
VLLLSLIAFEESVVMAASTIADLIERHEGLLITEWISALENAGTFRTGQLQRSELLDEAKQFVAELKAGVRARNDSIEGPEWSGMRELLSTITRSRALHGYSPTETVLFILSFKEPLFKVLRRQLGGNADALADEVWTATRLLDRLGLLVAEVHQKSREEVIHRQSRELLELSTPVVQLWSRILALPLIGTLDSERTQIVMERLLESIVSTGAEIAIIDISGVPTVDTLVAQHLIKTISAARLMGADCIVSGIRPQIAQTIVHLGLDLNVVSKATMADAFALALRRTGQAAAGAPSSRHG